MLLEAFPTGFDQISTQSCVSSLGVHFFADVEVNPLIASEADPGAHLEVEAGVPVDDEEDLSDERQDPEAVRIVRSRFRSIDALEQTVHAQHPVDANDRRTWSEDDVEDVSWKNADDVKIELLALCCHVMMT